MNLLQRIKESFSIQKFITEEDLIKIRKADWDTCAEWYNKLNSWEWPEELFPEEKPSTDYTHKSRRGMLMDIIENKIGEKFILMKLNTSRDMTQEEFEDFWTGSHENNEPAYKRYLDRVHKMNCNK